VKRRGPKNLTASVQARLLNLARHRGEDFQLVLTRYGIERLLYRLSRSPYRDEFILKGAMLFQVWADEPHRPTRDLDLLGRGPTDVQRLTEVFRAICTTPVVDDGIHILVDTIHGEEIRETQEYRGVRVLFEARLANMRIPIQVDVGFGDAVTPGPVEIEFPTLLDLPPPVLNAYSRETVVAEKLQAMVMLGVANSRMKDFFDVWVLRQEYEFNGATLSEAIGATFRRRTTNLPDDVPVALSTAFADDAGQQAQWRAFLNRGKLSVGDATLADVITALREFLMPPVHAARTGRRLDVSWYPGGPWAG
jgi:predicted nucleotidyltransferase component of viral defense system